MIVAQTKSFTTKLSTLIFFPLIILTKFKVDKLNMILNNIILNKGFFIYRKIALLWVLDYYKYLIYIYIYIVCEERINSQ